MSNRLQHESSPYLRQHAENPVEWYPWCDEAFARAREEDKPIFLSIGYSSCHWCHVMAHESFESEDVAHILNSSFIPIKVDKEERPDVDGVYMRVCQAFTGSGGWPTSIFMTPDQKPFFAGTYFPKNRRRGMIGFLELLIAIRDQWESDRETLLERADEIVAHLCSAAPNRTASEENLIEKAVGQYKRSFDRVHGGFGSAPKFPTPHNLLFLLENYRRTDRAECADMAARTLMQMYRGGMFDHVGGGFSRYSTDAQWLVPHFEKMLYDNALLVMAYARAHAVMGDQAEADLFMEVAGRTSDYVLREMTSPEGGFYSAQDADSEGEEGKFYVFTPGEIERIVPSEDFSAFCRRYDVSQKGNFEGKCILNLLGSDPFDEGLDQYLEPLYRYRKERHSLHLDDKILTSWNGLMIAALCELYLESGNRRWLEAAQGADRFIRDHLFADGVLHAGFASGKLGAKGFLDDYAAYCFAQLALYRATLEHTHLETARKLCGHVLDEFTDNENGGFYFSGKDSETLILRPKESYDGAMPSGNSLMAWNLVRLWQLTGDEAYHMQAQRQMDFLSSEAADYPIGHGMFLCALQEYLESSMKVVIVSESGIHSEKVVRLFPMHTILRLQAPTGEYPLANRRMTYYVCAGTQCFPPVNDLRELPEFAR